MGSSEKFCLRWNDFETNISVAFRELREEKDFFDVTLACDDSQVQAHKVILSACSPFFRNVLRRNPHQHPLLYLKGVKYKELLSVLNFMYMGEVNVAQEELNSFLSVAEDLRVKGLTQNNASSESSAKVNLPKAEPMKTVNRPIEREPPPPIKRPRPTPAPPAVISRPSYQTEEDDIQEVVPVKSEPRDTFQPAPQSQQQTSSMSHPVAPLETEEMYQDQGLQEQDQGTVALDDTYADESYDYGQYGEGAYDDGSGMIDPNTGMPLAGGADGNKGRAPAEGYHFQEPSELLQFLRKDKLDLKYYCTICENFSHKLSSCTRNHVESQHFPNHFTYTCDICEMNFGTKTTLNLHRSRKHKTRSYNFHR